MVGNIEIPDRGNEDYVIPSLLVLKQKVDLVFGSQPIVSLSNDRKGVSVDTCGDSIGKERFRFYAKSILNKKDMMDEGESTSYLDVTPSISLTPLSVQPSSLINTPQSSYSLPTPSTYQRLSLSLPFSSSLSSSYHRLHFLSTPPSRTHVDSLLAKYHQPLCFYDTLGTTHEFDTLSYLQSLGLIQPSQKCYQNRLIFWKEMLSQQISLPTNRVYRRYRYSCLPPRLSDIVETTVLDESLSMVRTNPIQFGSFPSLTQSSLNQTQYHSHNKPELRLMNIEFICENEEHKKSNPRSDQIIATFYSYSISYDSYRLYLIIGINTTMIQQSFILVLFSVGVASFSQIDSTFLSIVIPPYVQNSFDSCHYVMTEMELISATVNAIISFNPDLIIEYEVIILMVHYLDST